MVGKNVFHLGIIESDIASLIKEMERSIEEADAFVRAMTEVET